MSAMSFALGAAADIAAQAQAAGIEIASVDVYAPDAKYMRLSIRTTDGDLTPALALELGLTERRVVDYKDGSDIEAFTGHVGSIEVSTAHEIPADSLVVTTTGAVDIPAPIEATPIPENTVAVFTCPCGATSWLTKGATDEDRAVFDAEYDAHADCEVAR